MILKGKANLGTHKVMSLFVVSPSLIEVCIALTLEIAVITPIASILRNNIASAIVFEMLLDSETGISLT